MPLNFLDLLAIALLFLSMVIVGIMSYYKSKNSDDYIVAGGKLPWWLAGISHHVSGHSGAVFVAGLLTFIIGKQVHFDSLALEVGLPTIVAGLVFVIVGLTTRTVPEKVSRLVDTLRTKS